MILLKNKKKIYLSFKKIKLIQIHSIEILRKDQLSNKNPCKLSSQTIKTTQKITQRKQNSKLSNQRNQQINIPANLIINRKNKQLKVKSQPIYAQNCITK